MKMLPAILLLGLFSLFSGSIVIESVAPGIAATKDTFSCIGQPLDTYIPDYDVSGCRKFYLCSRAESGVNVGDAQNSVLTLSFMCPTGQAFDTKINDCRNASSVVCDRQTGSRTARKITKASLQLQKATDKFKTDFKCAGRKLGSYYADPQTNCSAFHLCSVGENRNEILNFKFQCLHGEIFDDEEQTCVSYKSDCNTFIIPSTTSTTTTTTTTTTTSTTPVPTTSTTSAPTTATPSTTTLLKLTEDYIYDTDANATDYEYYDVPENVEEKRKKRSTHINVRSVANVDLENAKVNQRLKRQISQRQDSAENLPSTSFTCENKVPGGHYADIETGCRMYHVCAPGPFGTMKNFRFLCSNNTIFSQQTRTCQAKHTVECGTTSLFYSLNEELSRVEPHQGTIAQSSDGAVPVANDPQPAVPAGTRKRPKSRRRRPKKPSTRVPTTIATTTASIFQFETPQPSITILHPEGEEVHTASPPIRASNIITSPVSQASTFDAFIQAALQQEQEQRIKFGPMLKQKRRQQEAEEEQRRRRLQVEDEQRRHIEHEEQQRKLLIQQENQHGLLLQQQRHEEERRILANEELNKQFEHHAPISVTSQSQIAASSAPVRQTTRRRKRPKTTTTVPISQEIPLWHIQESQTTTVRSTTVQSLIPPLPQPLPPIATPIQSLQPHAGESATQVEEQNSISFQSQQLKQAPLTQFSHSSHHQHESSPQTQTSAAQSIQTQSSPGLSPQTHTSFVQSPQTHTSPVHSPQTHTSFVQSPQTHASAAQGLQTHSSPAQSPHTHTSLVQSPQTHTPPVHSPQTHSPPVHSPQTHTSFVQSPQTHTSAEQSTQTHTSAAQSPQTHTSFVQSPQPHTSFVQSPQPHTSFVQSTQPHTSFVQSAQTHTSAARNPQIQTQNVFAQTQALPVQPQQQLFSIPQLPNFPVPTQQLQLNRFINQQFSLPQPSIQSPPPQHSGAFQTLTLNQPGVSIESLILEHLKKAQKTRLAQQQQQQALLASPSQATLFQPLGVHSRLIQFESPSSRTFEILTGHRAGRSTRQVQDFKRFKPIALKLAENARQQERQQHELQQTTFTCKGKVPGGYYADINTGCQMFHICSTGRDDSVIYDFRFVCANWTLFDQRSQTCSAEGKVRCLDSAKHFPKKFFDEPEIAIPEVELLKVRIKRAVEVVPLPSTSNQIDFPMTTFSCDGLLINRYYADHETNCQMFHLCTKSSTGQVEDHKFLCRNGTVFDQRSQACDDQTDALNCIENPTHYGIGEEIQRQR